jgi:hypothetical protein
MFEVRPHPERPLIWWYDHQDRINMAPSYQRRGSLWKQSKKAELVDSVLNNYDIPKIYLADFTYANTVLNEGKTSYAVIDGKQRLETFFGFFEGKFLLDRDFIFNDDPSLDLARLSYIDLKTKYPKIAQRFERFVPAIMSVITDEEERVDEMFVRLNSGLNVNAAERRNAMRGPIPKLIRKLALHEFFTQKISFDTRRMQEYNTVAKLLLIETKGRFVDTKARNLDAFVKDSARDELETYEEVQARIVGVLDQMTTVFRKSDPILNTEGPIPLFYWFVRNNRVNPRLRDFLERFKESVKNNLATAQQHPERADAELTTYYTMSRTTNDQASLSGRYEILLRRYQEFLES